MSLFRSFRVCSDAKERVGCGKQREATVLIQSLVKLQPGFLAFGKTAALGSCACNEGLSLGQNTHDDDISFYLLIIIFKSKLHSIIHLRFILGIRIIGPLIRSELVPFFHQELKVNKNQELNLRVRISELHTLKKSNVADVQITRMFIFSRSFKVSDLTGLHSPRIRNDFKV